MIAYLTGRIASVDPGGVVVEVGGIGYAVQCTPATVAGLRPGSEARVPTSMIVREDSLTLFGFADDDERDVFELLQTASGIGPKVAQAMLAVHDPESLRAVVAAEDLTALMLVPGIGKKGAQRIVLELKDRLGPATGGARRAPAAAPTAPADRWRDQVRDGLVALGWSAREAEEAVSVVADEQEASSGDPDVVDLTGASSSTEPDVAALLRAALRTLSRS